MDIRQVRHFLGEDWKKVEALFEETLHSDVHLLGRTHGYIRSNQGKMLRPVLSLLVSRACGTPGGDSVKAAVAAELLHNATLLHDDVLDDSTRRRGAPTVMSMLGAKASVLVGDFWLVKAMKTILACENHTKELSDIFAKTVLDLVEGEMLQMEKAGSGDTSEEDYLRIIYYKTASLFEAVCSSAALSVEAPQEAREAVTLYGKLLGMAFQIKDDILDYDGDALGKPVGADLREQKITLPLLGALRQMDADRETEVRQMVAGIGEHPSNCVRVAEMVRTLKGTNYAAERLEEYVKEAKESLRALPASEEKKMLLGIADYCAYRTI